uniref:Reverse transcriptase domain-containing protein n=1 Tax=Anolis carolinensis TaxID=28377 RepID=A0A803TZ67_ANOCA
MDWSLRCYSNNVNGLNCPQKRNKIFSQLKKQKYDVIALQESHISQRFVALLSQKALGKEYYSAAPDKKKGVVIYVKNNIPSELAFKDTEGRIVAIRIERGGHRLLICNIYSPNGSKGKFVKKLRELIGEQKFDDLILLGDFNGVIDNKIDRQIQSKKKGQENLGQLPQSFINLKKEYDLVDIWRLYHGTEKDYTYFSSRHNNWSRIDMIWSTKTISTKINKISILPRKDTDHCPLELKLNYKPGMKKWRLNENLLQKEEDIEKNKKLLKEYFLFNTTADVDDGIIWDASKAVMRGNFIQQNAIKNKLRNQKSLEIHKAIELAEKNLKKNPKNSKLGQELDYLNKQRQQLEMEQRAKELKFVKQYHFQNANKPGKWLTHTLRRKRQEQWITQIKDGTKVYTSEKEIMDQFSKYFGNLYKSDYINREEVMLYLGRQKIQRLTDDQREMLNKDISHKEIDIAIRKLDPNKAPGPDGLTPIYYKRLKDDLIPHLQKVMNNALHQKQIPKSWKEANIILLPKDNSDPNNIKNYRPISLLNTDYKIFALIIAERLKLYLTNWIKEEQSGILPDRSIKNNVRSLVNIIEYYEKHNQKEVAIMTVDAEKAFDRINWDLFKMLMREMDIGNNFMNAIQAIYEDQTANIWVNGQSSNKIRVEKGTRQGCPLSPLIFVMSLELLLNNLRDDDNLKGLKIGKETYKLRAFADDLVCIIEDPLNNIKKWLREIEDFGKISGFRINKDKSMILTKNVSKERQSQIRDITGMKTPTKIKYLGIYLTTKNSQLLQNNYINKWKEIKNNLKNWSSLKLSLLGRIAVIKSNVLPKMIYLFQNLPIIRNQKLFKEWNKDISKFIWNNKKPRINFTNLTDAKNRGGLGLPNLALYSEACGLDWVRDWINLSNKKMLTLEGHDLRAGWHAYLWYNKAPIEKNFGNHFIRSALLKIWNKYKQRIYNKTPLWVSSMEARQRRELGWNTWPTYRDILEKEGREIKLKSQEELKLKYGNLTWLQYYQLKESFNKDKIQGFEDKVTPWDVILSKGKRKIAKMYKFLLEWSTEKEQIKECMTNWARDLGRTILLEEWELLWGKKLNYTYAYELKENWWKMFYRWHLTPKRISKFTKGKKIKCWKCGRGEGSYLHMWWSCEKVKPYWREIHDKCQKILKIKIPLLPEFFLLGMTNNQWGKNEDKIFTHLTTAARLVLARLWNQKLIPKVEEWIKRIWDIMNMDYLTFLLSTTQNKPKKGIDWTLVKDWMKKEKVRILL